MSSRLFVVVLISIGAAAAYGRQPAPGLIVHNGKILTVDPQFRIVEAMAIRDGKIQAVGTNADVLELAGPGTERVDLRGKTVLPGLIDSHVHAPGASMYEFEGTVPDMESIEDVLGYLRGRAE